MNGWETIFEDQVEERPITIKIYRSDDDEDQDTGPAIRVLTTSPENHAGKPEPSEDGEMLIAGSEAAGLPIALEPSTLEDLREELVEIGFSPEAAATIASKVPA